MTVANCRLLCQILNKCLTKFDNDFLTFFNSYQSYVSDIKNNCRAADNKTCGEG